jgi:hypothetical protein
MKIIIEWRDNSNSQGNCVQVALVETEEED